MLIKTDQHPLAQHLAAVILAGGQASRFGGKEKGLIEFKGEPMVARVAGTLRAGVSHLIISANRHQSSYECYADQVIGDRIGRQWGPLAGIYTALTATTADWLLVATCDQPLLPANYVGRMVEQLSVNSKTIFVAVDAKRDHFLNLLLPVSSAADLYDYLAGGGRRVSSWLELLGYHRVEFANGCLDSINSSLDLDRMERMKIAPLP